MSYALHYPSIEFQDELYLKRSLFVWDRVFRIVPRGYSPRDSRAVAEATEAGVVENIALDSAEKAKAAEGFLDFYEKRRRSTRLTWPAGLDSPTFVRINPEKIEARLRPLFEELAQKTGTENGFLSIAPDLAGGYMFYLAEAVARSRNLSMLTDSSDSWTVGSYFEQSGNFGDYVRDQEADSVLCSLTIAKLLPADLESVSMKRLLRFRESHIEEREAFRKEVLDLRSAIANCKNKSHAEYVVKDGVDRLVRAKNEYARAIAPFGRQDLDCALTVSVPTLTSSIALVGAAGQDPFSLISLSSGLFLGGIAALAKKALVPRDKGVGSYLIATEGMPDSHNSALYRRFEEFVND